MPEACDSVANAVSLLVFDAFDSDAPCQNATGVYAFAWLAAMSFAAVTIVDLIIFLLRKYGLSANASRAGFRNEDSWPATVAKAALAIFAGAIAAWIVAFLAAIVEFLKIAPQTAVATGALWQVAYSQLLTRLGNETGGTPPPPAGTPEVQTMPADVQRFETELEE